ncbi:MAG: four helix bundle protein [Bacteroidia bacterium]
MDSRKENIIVELSFNFALGIIAFSEILEEKRKYIVARQLLKSGTSIGANVREAQNAESKADFIHKMKIALKETDETIYWLSLIQKSESYPNCNDLIEKVNVIDKVLTKIVSTSKNKITQN